MSSNKLAAAVRNGGNKVMQAISAKADLGTGVTGVTRKAKDLLAKYENFTGVTEVMRLQGVVLQAQEKFVAAQDRRRESSNKLIALQWRLKEIHDEMQSTPKGEEKYLKLVTEEHKLINEEQQIRTEFLEVEREEREHFNAMSLAVKTSHEQERMQTERSKYWYVVASLLGTGLGVLGSTLNNRMKMAEFREMLVDQIQKTSYVQMSDGPVQQVHQERYNPELDLARDKQLKELEMRVAAISQNQGTILQIIRQNDRATESWFKELKHLIIKSKALSEKHEKELMEVHSQHAASEKLKALASQYQSDWNIDTESVLKGVGVVGGVLLLLGFIFSNR